MFQVNFSTCIILLIRNKIINLNLQKKLIGMNAWLIVFYCHTTYHLLLLHLLGDTLLIQLGLQASPYHKWGLVGKVLTLGF